MHARAVTLWRLKQEVSKPKSNTLNWFRTCNSTMVMGGRNAEVLLCIITDKFDRSWYLSKSKQKANTAGTFRTEVF